MSGHPILVPHVPKQVKAAELVELEVSSAGYGANSNSSLKPLLPARFRGERKFCSTCVQRPLNSKLSSRTTTALTLSTLTRTSSTLGPQAPKQDSKASADCAQDGLEVQ